MNYDRRVIEALKKKEKSADFPFLKQTVFIAVILFLVLTLFL